MKTKYERMTKQDKKDLYNKFKLDKKELTKKMETMFIIIYFGLLYGVIMFIYDFFFKHSKVGYILDIIVFIFCICAYFKVYSIKKDLLNRYAIKKDRK